MRSLHVSRNGSVAGDVGFLGVPMGLVGVGQGLYGSALSLRNSLARNKLDFGLVEQFLEQSRRKELQSGQTLWLHAIHKGVELDFAIHIAEDGEPLLITTLTQSRR